MPIRVCTAVVVAALLASSSLELHAHFKLLEPVSWLVENNLGDPQKAAP